MICSSWSISFLSSDERDRCVNVRKAPDHVAQADKRHVLLYLYCFGLQLWTRSIHSAGTFITCLMTMAIKTEDPQNTFHGVVTRVVEGLTLNLICHVTSMQTANNLETTIFGIRIRTEKNIMVCLERKSSKA